MELDTDTALQNTIAAGLVCATKLREEMRTEGVPAYRDFVEGLMIGSHFSATLWGMADEMFDAFDLAARNADEIRSSKSFQVLSGLVRTHVIAAVELSTAEQLVKVAYRSNSIIGDLANEHGVGKGGALVFYAFAIVSAVLAGSEDSDQEAFDEAISEAYHKMGDAMQTGSMFAEIEKKKMAEENA